MNHPMLTGFFLVVLSMSCGSRPQTISAAKDQFSGLNFFYYDRADRIKALQSLGEEIEVRYSLLDIKKARLNVDHNALFLNAIEAERQAIDPDNSAPLDQAASNMAFIDRAKKLIASYKDTHFAIGGLARRPRVINGVKFVEVGGRFYVNLRSAKILGYADLHSASPIAGQISLGDELVSVGGKPVHEVVEALMPFESGSTESYSRSSAVTALTDRNYRYPEVSYEDFGFKTADGRLVSVRLPWYYDATVNRRDASAYFASRGISGIQDVLERWNESSQKWELSSKGWSGFDEFVAPEDAIGVNTWVAEADTTETVYQTGYLLKDGKSFGFIQLYTYMLSSVKKADTGAAVNWDVPLKNFIKELKANHTPLVLDIRYNGGGRTSIPPQILSMITPNDRSYPSLVSGYRITRHVRNLVDLWDTGQLPDLNDPIETLALEEVRTSVANQRTHTRMIARSSGIKADITVGGYDLPVVVLISPHCISSCDIQSFLVKGSKRGLLLGTHSNGTGAGFTSDGPFTNGPWSDSYGILKTQIPNFLFGYAGRTDVLVNPELDGYLQFDTENVPTVADVQYQDTLEDYLHQGRGWYGKAIEILGQTP